MGFPYFRFTLGNTIEGSLEIKEPEGWDDGVLKLERNKDYHSLVEYFDQPLVFDDAQAYNIDTGLPIPGGLSYITNIEQTQGIDAQITILIEISHDFGVTYETIFTGVLDIETVKETDFYKLECGVKRDDFWSKFINRKSIPVDLESITDLDGNSRTLVPGITLPLPSQRMRQDFLRSTDYNDANEGLFLFGQGSGTLNYLLFGNSYNEIDEVTERVEYGTQLSTLLPTDVSKYYFKVEFGGTYRIQADIRASYIFGASRDYDIKWWYVLRENGTLGTPAQIGATQSGTGSSVEGLSSIVLDETETLEAGDEIYIYGELVLNTTTTITYFSDYDSDAGAPFVPVYTSFEVTADTIFGDTSTDAYLLVDAMESTLSKYVGADDVLRSDYLYDPGCGNPFAITKGLNIRGYDFDEKPMAVSFDQLWNGANPIFNLGLGYELVGSPEVNKIRIEPKEYFYDITTSLNLDFVNNIERSYELDYIFKSIEIGYNKWSAESDSGVDDPQSKRFWRTRFATIGKDEKILSLFIAASLAIEQTRRNRVEQGKDWRLDEDIMIIALVQGSPDWEPEFDQNFNFVSGLLNSDARYNIRLSVARNFERWKNFFNGCLQTPGTDDFIFASGEGNFDMTSQLNGDDCEATDASPEPVIDEKGDVAVTNDFLFIPIVYDFEHPLTFEEYETIRDNRTKAIGVSRTNSGHSPCFILNLDYKPTRGLGTFTVNLGSNDPL